MFSYSYKKTKTSSYWGPCKAGWSQDGSLSFEALIKNIKLLQCYLKKMRWKSIPQELTDDITHSIAALSSHLTLEQIIKLDVELCKLNKPLKEFPHEVIQPFLKWYKGTDDLLCGDIHKSKKTNSKVWIEARKIEVEENKAHSVSEDTVTKPLECFNEDDAANEDDILKECFERIPEFSFFSLPKNSSKHKSIAFHPYTNLNALKVPRVF